MVKDKKKKYMGLGTLLENSFVLYNHAVLWHQTNTKLLVDTFLYDMMMTTR